LTNRLSTAFYVSALHFYCTSIPTSLNSAISPPFSGGAYTVTVQNGFGRVMGSMVRVCGAPNNLLYNCWGR